MDNPINHPHDKRYKELFSHKKSFISLLSDCVKAPWVDDIDEDSLTQAGVSFISQDFSAKEADIVYEAKLRGGTIVFYVLLELQSKVDYRMPYRLLLYMVEVLRHYYNHADTKARDTKNFKFPVVFPIIFFSGSETWTVPLNLREMFAGADVFGEYVLNFEYMLVNAKGYDNESLRKFKSKLLGTTLMLEKARNDVEFLNGVRENLEHISAFDGEEKRVLNLCIKILDIAYGYNRSEAIKDLLAENKIVEADKMLCDMIENARHEKEQLIAQGLSQGRSQGLAQGLTQGRSQGLAQGLSQGELKKALEVAKAMMAEKYPVDIIMRFTKLTKAQIENIGA